MGTFVCSTCGGTEPMDSKGNYTHRCPGKPKDPSNRGSSVPPGKKNPQIVRGKGKK